MRRRPRCSATNDARRDPSRRPAAIPATYARAAVTTPSASTGTHHGAVVPTNSTASVVAAIGTMPTSPATTSATEPTSSPPAARASGGRPLPSSADITKYVAAPTIAPSAQSTPTRLMSAPESRSRTSTRPAQRDHGAGDRERGRGAAVPQPQPGDHRDRRGVLDEQRHPDLHVLDRVEVAELTAGHRDQAVGRPPARRCARSSDQRPRIERYAGTQQHEGGDHDAGGHRRTGGPAGVEQAAGQRARQAERRRGHQGEHQPAAEPRGAPHRDVMSDRRHD